MTPEKANGFVIWSDADSVKYWEVEVIERSPLTDSTYHDSRVWRHEEWRNNYVYIPEKYRPLDTLNKYGVNLYGKNASNEVVIEEEVIPLYECEGCEYGGYYPFVYIICNGPDYAWKVQQVVSMDSWGHKYQLLGASIEGEPIYEYMTNTTYNAFLDNIGVLQDFLIYYGINNQIFLTPEGPDFTNMYVKNITNSPDVEYTDKYGNVIQDNAFKAVRKAAGPWNDAVATQTYTEVLDIDPLNGLYLNYNLQYAMDLMNSEQYGAEVNPALECTGQGYTPPYGEGSWEEGWANCDDLVSDELYDFNDTDEISQFLNDWHDCINPIDNGGGGNSGGNGNPNLPWGDVLEFSMSHANQNGLTEVFHRKSGDFYDESGDFLPFSFTLSPGLHYMYAVLDQETDVIPDLFFEVTEPVTIGITYAHMFNFTAFPVPHVEDKFSINMQAAVNLSASYELFDFQGNKIHKAHYNLKQGHNEDHRIVPDEPIPSGLLVHRFTFEDGSTKTLTTMRQ